MIVGTLKKILIERGIKYTHNTTKCDSLRGYEWGIEHGRRILKQSNSNETLYMFAPNSPLSMNIDTDNVIKEWNKYVIKYDNMEKLMEKI